MMRGDSWWGERTLRGHTADPPLKEAFIIFRIGWQGGKCFSYHNVLVMHEAQVFTVPS
jgi:alpha-ketoglutarate-dependent taurine dioxygenase